MEKYVVGVDVGTGSARAAVFTAAGERRGLAVEPIQLWKPEAQYAEQSSADIWRAVGKGVRSAVAEAQIAPEDVAGIGFDATCSLVVLGESDAPLTVSPTGKDEQNIIVWMDHRATAEADEINRGDHKVLRYVGGKISPEMETPKLLWLKRHLPQTWSAATKFLDLADFLTYTATGKDVRSLCTNVCKWTYLGQEGRWDTDFFRAIGLSDIPDERRVTGNVRPLGERIGPLTPKAAAHLGLSTNCHVAVGIIDAHAGGLGLLGAAWEGGGEPDPAALEGVLALIGGTSACHMAASREAVFVPGVWGPYYGAMVPGMWLTEGGQSAAGALVDFVVQTGTTYPALKEEADAAGETVYQILNNRLLQIVQERGVQKLAHLTREYHLLDYHLGNRSPQADPHARGVADGLTLTQSRDADAIAYLAAIQAVAYGTREVIEAMNRAGFTIGKILVTGGGTKNPLWLQQHADALQMPLVLGRESESVLLGAAILGASAGGVHPSVTAAMQAMGRSGETVPPNPETRAYHDAKYTVYKRLYQTHLANRETMRGF